MPDDELYRAAGQGTLSNPALLEAQVRRMLKDPKSVALVDNFAGQWLEIRNIDGVKETVNCGAGKKDKASVDKRDRVKGCEKVTRAKK